MQNQQIIQSNVCPGDILLSRKTTDPIIQKKLEKEGARSFWRHCYLYVGEDQVISDIGGQLNINNLNKYFDDSHVVGLFRIQPKISNKNTEILLKKSKKLLKIRYGYLWLFWKFILGLIGMNKRVKEMVCAEMITKAYSKIDINLQALPTRNVNPIDFDESSITIRIV